MPRTLTHSRSDGAASVTTDGEEPPADPSARPSRRRRRLVAGLVVAALAVVVVLVATGGGQDDGAGQGGETGSTATAQVSTRTLTQTEEVEGTLDFGETHSLTSGRAGTLTAAAASGSTVDRSGELYSIDRQPTVLLFGDLPFYRDLDEGAEDGPDVGQLEENLAALGFTDDGQMVVDEHFDAATTNAVEAWQEARGVEATGTVVAGDVVFLPGAARIAEPRLDLGATVQAGGAVLDYTSATQVVRAQLELSQADLAQLGDEVTVALPDGSDVAGTVAEITTSTSSTDTSSSASNGAAAPGGETATSTAEETVTVDVTVSLADPDATASFTTASVGVLFTSGQAKDVLTVPVTALLATLEGSYAVEVPNDDGTSRLVAVEPGMFADGYVEISGDGVSDGMTVVVPE